MRNRTPFLVLAASTLLALGCSVESGAAGEHTGSGRQAVIKGTASDASQDAVVLLVMYDKTTGEFGECTGTLLAPNLVLTARHCVSQTDESAACDEKGTPIASGQVYKDHKAETLYVFTGNKRPDFYSGDVKPAGQGAKVFTDGAKNLCNHDIALVMLKNKIEGAPIAPIRLEGEIAKGDSVTSVGWGVTDKSAQPSIRQQRPKVQILDVGPSAENMVPPNEFEVGESICSGDSGGPALADGTNAIIGVVSRGGNGSQGNGRDPAAQCINGTNLYTKVQPFKDLVLQAADEAGAEIWQEGQPDPRLAKTGEACDGPAACRSGICLSGGMCSQSCDAENPCPDGLECNDEGGQKVCTAPKPKNAAQPAGSTTTSSGCSTTGGSTNAGSIALAMIGLAVAATSRRRKK
jgi:MYXO-CTERM domain-containing protein